MNMMTNDVGRNLTSFYKRSKVIDLVNDNHVALRLTINFEDF